jgi:hypothetical protein
MRRRRVSSMVRFFLLFFFFLLTKITTTKIGVLDVINGNLPEVVCFRRKQDELKIAHIERRVSGATRALEDAKWDLKETSGSRRIGMYFFINNTSNLQLVDF